MQTPKAVQKLGWLVNTEKAKLESNVLNHEKQIQMLCVKMRFQFTMGRREIFISKGEVQRLES